MPQWTLSPLDNFPQTKEGYLNQIEQELVSAEERARYLLDEKDRTLSEIEGSRIYDSQ